MLGADPADPLAPRAPEDSQNNNDGAALQGAGSRSQDIQPADLSAVARSLGVDMPALEIASRYYQESAAPYLVRLPPVRRAGRDDPLMGNLETWETGEDLADIDWSATMAASPWVVPGVTTRRRHFERDPGEDQHMVPTNLRSLPRLLRLHARSRRTAVACGLSGGHPGSVRAAQRRSRSGHHLVRSRADRRHGWLHPGRAGGPGRHCGSFRRFHILPAGNPVPHASGRSSGWGRTGALPQSPSSPTAAWSPCSRTTAQANARTRGAMKRESRCGRSQRPGGGGTLLLNTDPGVSRSCGCPGDMPFTVCAILMRCVVSAPAWREPSGRRHDESYMASRAGAPTASGCRQLRSRS